MGEGEDAATAAAAAAAAVDCGGDDASLVTRIYVGGLSASVTAADMEKTFSSLGKVTGVEFVRDKGRCFAFMDFVPSSDRTLAKLFSTYNGCTWKGGKLKLEKAKEHYLARLKREWAEDAKHVPTTAVNPSTEKKAGHLKMSELSNQGKLQLRIFFPKLRKLKPLPFKGTGKHKYSFQRIEVPSLPIHFCDCEEHYDPSEMALQKYSTSLNEVIHEKELRISSRVLSKILKEDNKTDLETFTKSATDTSISSTSIDDIRPDEEEEEEEKEKEAAYQGPSDADNLVTNIWMGSVDDILMQYKGRASDQETRYAEHRTSKKDNSTQNDKLNSLRRHKAAEPPRPIEVTPNRRVHPKLAGGINGHESTTTPISPRNTSCEGYPQEPEMTAEAPPVQSRKGNSWLQKSSWKDLIGKSDNRSFSISDVPGISPMRPELAEASDSAIAISPGAQKRKAEPDAEKSNFVRSVAQYIPREKAVGPRPVEKSVGGYSVRANPDEVSQRREAQLNGDQEPKRKIPKAGTSDVCTFMRSTESEKEWAMAKAAVSGYIKKKSIEKDPAKSLKGMPSRKR